MTTDDIAKQLSDLDLKGQAWDDKARELGLKPGQLIPGTQQWVPWRVQDLNSDDTVDFVPQDVPTIICSIPSANGKKLLKLDVNGLEVLYEVGTVTRTNKYFYNVYKNVLDQNIALENLKKYGPKWGPHSNAGYDGQSTWHYIPEAFSFAFDINGKSLSPAEHYELDEDGIPVSLGRVSDLIKMGLTSQLPFEVLLWIACKRVPKRIKAFAQNTIKRGIKDGIRRARRHVQRKAK